MLFAVLSASLGLGLSQSAPSPRAGRPAVEAGVCEQEAKKSAGAMRVRVGKSVPQPKRIHYVPPKYPALPPGTSLSPGVWMGEFLIGADGKVVQVWPIREFRFMPPFPRFNQVIVDSIKNSLYEPLKIDGRPVPVCVTVSVNINWS